jgi:hypothetical protein
MTNIEMVKLGDFGLKEIEALNEQYDTETDELFGKITEVEARLLRLIEKSIRFEHAVSFIEPLLKQNPSWKWRDAVAHLKANGGLPTYNEEALQDYLRESAGDRVVKLMAHHAADKCLAEALYSGETTRLPDGNLIETEHLTDEHRKAIAAHKATKAEPAA